MKKSFVVVMGIILLALVSCGTQVAPVKNIETPVVENPAPSEIISSETEESNVLSYDYAYNYSDTKELEAFAEKNLGNDWRNFDRVGAPFQFQNTKIFRFSDKTSIDLNGDFGNLGLSPLGDKIAFDKFDKSDEGEGTNTYVYNIGEDTKILQNISKDFRSSLDWIDENTFSLYDFSDETKKVSSTSDIQSYSGSVQWFENENYMVSSQNGDGKISYFSQNGNILGEYNLMDLGGCTQEEWYQGITLISPQTVAVDCDNTKIFGYDVQNKNLTFKIDLSKAPFSTLSSEYSFMDYRVTKDTVIVRLDKTEESGAGKGESVFFVYNIESKTFGEPLYEKDFATNVRMVK